MIKLWNDIRTAWYFFWWHRRQPKPELSRGKVIGCKVCITDVRYKHPAYTPVELTEEVMRVACEHLLARILLAPYKVDVLTEKPPGHNHTLISLMATPVRASRIP